MKEEYLFSLLLLALAALIGFLGGLSANYVFYLSSNYHGTWIFHTINMIVIVVFLVLLFLIIRYIQKSK